MTTSLANSAPPSTSGPCIFLACTSNATAASAATICAAAVDLCTAGSTDYINYFNRSSSTTCAFSTESAARNDSCQLFALAGTIAGSGAAYSLYDATSTMSLDYRVNTASGTTFPEFFVTADAASISAQYNHFLQTATSGTSAVIAQSTMSNGAVGIGIPVSSSAALAASSGTPAVVTVSSTVMPTTAASSGAMSASSVTAAASSAASSAAGSASSGAAAAATSSRSAASGGSSVSWRLAAVAGFFVVALVSGA